MSNLAIWDALAKTDPKHTKPFARSGGFKGTSLKPIWIIKRMTEQFGPAGQGWGVNEPQFQVVTADGEILVYCTVSCWHTDRSNILWGVGGDKVQTKRQSGTFNDDEAFKKAFTDAVNNALKSIGVGGDIHMGLFEDDKYVTATKAEFAEPEQPSAPEPLISDDERAQLLTLADTHHVLLGDVCAMAKIKDLRELESRLFNSAKNWIIKNARKEAA